MKHCKIKQEVYMDLEVIAMKNKDANSIVFDIKQLIKNYPNDIELGYAIRKYFIKNDHDADNRI